MLNNRGVSILRIIIIIFLVVLLFLLAKPSYDFLSKYIDRMNARNNISKLETLATDYASDYIDNYRKCVGEVDSSCLISIDTLREKNYIYDNKILINPVTDEVLNGNVLVCFNGETSFKGKYTENYSNTYYCNEVIDNNNGYNEKPNYSGKKITDIIKNEPINVKDVNGELRYVSINAKNYIQFDSKLYRILGLVYDASGSYRLKITSISPIVFNNYSEVSNSWTSSKVYEYLNNGAFYNNISDDYKKFIEVGNFDLGYCSDVTNCLDTNSEKWNGMIGVLSVRDIVLSTNCGQISSECFDTSYLKPEKEVLLNHNDSNIYVMDKNSIYQTDFRTSVFARPTFYIDKDVVVIDGTGSKYDPFIIGMGN